MKQILNTQEIDLYDFNSILTHTRAVSRSAADLRVRNRAKLSVAYCNMMDNLDPTWRSVAVTELNKMAMTIHIDMDNAFFDFKLITGVLHVADLVVSGFLDGSPFQPN